MAYVYFSAYLTGEIIDQVDLRQDSDWPVLIDDGMVACCAHHVTDVLPILGLTAAATFLARYRMPFMLFGLG